MIKRDVQRAMAEGTTLWCKVSGQRVSVKVIRETTERAFGTRSGSNRAMTKFVLARVDPQAPSWIGKELPKARSAQSLHPTDGRKGEWPGMTARQDRAVQAMPYNRYLAGSPKVEHKRADGTTGTIPAIGGWLPRAKVTPQVPALDGMAPLGLADCRYGRPHCGCAHDGGRCEYDTDRD